MIMVDSSVWIDYFTGIGNQQTDTLDKTLGSTPVALGDLILTDQPLCAPHPQTLIIFVYAILVNLR